MRILIAHNEYGKYSGEEAVVDKMVDMFTRNDLEVDVLRKSTAMARNNLIGQINGFIQGIYSVDGIKDMRRKLYEFKPDIVNVHNLFPFISPAALRECKKKHIPVVMTVHNFRLICPTGLFMRNGKPCELCLKNRNEWGCLKYNCENNVLKSLGYTLRNYFARIGKYYIDCVDKFVCITDFQRNKLTEYGFPDSKLEVIPNSIDLVRNLGKPSIGNYVAYVGRLSYEKGFDLLLNVAEQHPNITFKFAGDIRNTEICNIPSNVQLLGYLKEDHLTDFILNSRFVVMPSRCYEGFPMAILEAAQYYKPVIAPNHGGFSEIIGSGDDKIGVLFKPNDIDDLGNSIKLLWDDFDEISKLGHKAHKKLIDKYSSEVVSRQWIELIKKVISK